MSRHLPLVYRLLLGLKEGPGECWGWTGKRTKDGYGQIIVAGGRREYIHRIVYELYYGPIPEGLEIDHVQERGCQSRSCANPAHLEAVTHAENMRRWHRQQGRTTCHAGHAYNETNTYTDKLGYRHCRVCVRERHGSRNGQLNAA